MTYAGFWRRFAALFIDALITLIPSYLLSKVVPYAGELLVAILYYPVFEASVIQATPGKYVMGMKVIRENGEGLTFWRAVLRQFAKGISFALLLIGYLMQPFTARRQTFHDLIVGSVVIRHAFVGSPDWLGAWMQVMRYVLRVDDKQPTSAPIDVSTTSASQSTTVEPSTAASNAHSAEALVSIEKLHELYKLGAISEDEYQSKKAELLKQV